MDSNCDISDADYLKMMNDHKMESKMTMKIVMTKASNKMIEEMKMEI